MRRIGAPAHWGPVTDDELHQRSSLGSHQLRGAPDIPWPTSPQRRRLAHAARELATATADQFEEKVVDASGRASSQWDEVRGKWKAHVAKVRSNIEAKMDEQDAKAAALDADLAEDYALDAISFAQGAIEEAEAASLDAVYARANAVALSS